MDEDGDDLLPIATYIFSKLVPFLSFGLSTICFSLFSRPKKNANLSNNIRKQQYVDDKDVCLLWKVQDVW